MKFIYQNNGKRLNRFEFFCWTIFVSALWFTNGNLVEDEFIRYLLYFFLISLYLVFSYYRTNDYGNPHYYGAYWFLIPFFNIYVLFELYLKKGDPNANRFGIPPKVGFYNEVETSLYDVLKEKENVLIDQNTSETFNEHDTSDSIKEDNYLHIYCNVIDHRTLTTMDSNVHSYWTLNWAVNNGDYVLKDQIIVSCSSIRDKFEIKSTTNGYINRRKSNSIEVEANIEKELFTIYDSDINRQKETFIINYSVNKDSFTNEDHYYWKKIQLNKDLSFYIESVSGKDYICFEHNYPELNLREEDKIMFLLSNNDLLQFHLIKGKYKINKNLKGFRLPLYFEDIDLLSKFSIEKIRIHKVIENQNVDLVTESFAGMPIKDFHYLTKGIFSNFREFTTTLENHKPLNRSLDDFENVPINDRCYVYLMIDTTNGYHKIGISNKPGYREKTLQSEKPSIELICHKHFPSRKISESIEKALHETFKDKRIRGEWFNLSGSDIDEIKETLR
jgi:hypothetical protein